MGFEKIALDIRREMPPTLFLKKKSYLDAEWVTTNVFLKAFLNSQESNKNPLKPRMEEPKSG